MTKFYDYDWDDLPEHVQHSAAILGYTREIWQSDDETSITEKSWGELTLEQKGAAAELGYTQDTWDEE